MKKNLKLNNGLSLNHNKTSQELPTIKKKDQSKSFLHQSKIIQTANNKNPYSYSLKGLTQNIVYQQLSLSSIGTQQQRLKSMLKKMNKDTIKMIETISPKKLRDKQKNQNESVMIIRNQQITNNQQIMQLCKYQIQKLIKKSQQILGQGNKDYYYNKILSTKKQIQQISTQIRQMKWQNYKRGKQIIKQQYSLNDLNKLQYQCQILEDKVKRLKRQDIKVTDQIYNLLDKTQQIKQSFKKAQEYLENNKPTISNLEKTKEIEYLNKKIQLENLKKKKQFNCSNWQFRYFRCLKNIEIVVNGMKVNDNQINEIETVLENNKQQMDNLQEKLIKLKEKRASRQLQMKQYLKQQTKRRIEEDRSIEDINNNNNKAIRMRTPKESIIKKEEDQRSAHNETVSQYIPKKSYVIGQGNNSKVSQEIIDEQQARQKANIENQ